MNKITWEAGMDVVLVRERSFGVRVTKEKIQRVDSRGYFKLCQNTLWYDADGCVVSPKDWHIFQQRVYRPTQAAARRALEEQQTINAEEAVRKMLRVGPTRKAFLKRLEAVLEEFAEPLK